MNLHSDFLDGLYVLYVLDKLDLSTNKLAKKTGVSQSTISNASHLKHSLSWNILSKIQNETGLIFKGEEHIIFANNYFNKHKQTIKVSFDCSQSLVSFLRENEEFEEYPEYILFVSDNVAYIQSTCFDEDYKKITGISDNNTKEKIELPQYLLSSYDIEDNLNKKIIINIENFKNHTNYSYDYI